jgi:hypothetical protein
VWGWKEKERVSERSFWSQNPEGVKGFSSRVLVRMK